MIRTFLVIVLPLGTLCFNVPFFTHPFKISLHPYRGRYHHVKYSIQRTHSASVELLLASSSLSDDNQGDSDNDNFDDDISNDSLFESLRKRQKEIRSDSEKIEQKWCDADCRTSLPIQMDDWIRRIALGKWPIVAIGTAGGSIAITDMSTGEKLASVLSTHDQQGGDPKLLKLLYGNYDGGGVLAIDMQDNIVVSAGREGGIKIWQFDRVLKELISQGQPSSLEGIQVTSVALDQNGALWVGSFDNKLRKFLLNTTTSQLKIAKASIVEFEHNVVCLAINNGIALCVCGMEDGTVNFLSTSGELLSSWKPFQNTCTRSVAIVEVDDDTFNVVCGGGDGTMHIRSLAIGSDGEICSDAFDPGFQPDILRPSHNGPVVAMAARKGGLFVTGAHDGSIRVWDCRWDSRDNLIADNVSVSSPKPQAIARYHLLGYKVWLGSICVDEEGHRMFSDGCDNSIVLHDFSIADQSDNTT